MRTERLAHGAPPRRPRVVTEQGLPDLDAPDTQSLPSEASCRTPDGLTWPPAESPAGFDVSGLLGLIRRQIWLILLVTGLAAAAAVVAVSTIRSRFTATALVMLDQREARLLGQGATATPAADGEIEIMRSAHVAQLVVERMRLGEDPEFVAPSGVLTAALAAARAFVSGSIRTMLDGLGLDHGGALPPSEPDPTSAAIRALQQKVAIRRRGLTDVIAIEASSADPRRAAEIANTYAEVYSGQQVAAKLDAIERADASLSRRLAELGEALRRSETQIGTRQLYEETLLRLKALSQERSSVSANAQVAAPARAPDIPSWPPRGLLMMLGTAAGFGLGLGLAYFRDGRTRRVRTEQELESVAGVPNLGVVPLAGGGRRRADEIVKRPLSTYSEAIRRLHVGLDLLRKPGAPLGSVLVTAAQAGEARSVLALSLARSAAVAGTRVAIVDCDLRRPRLHALLGLKNDRGLVDLLTEPPDQTERSVVQSDPRSSCGVVTGGLVADLPPERLLGRDRFEQALRTLRREFDLVVLDGPPPSLFADGLILAHCADSVLLAVQAGRARFSEIRATLLELRRAGNPNVFTVLTGSGHGILL